MVLTRRAIILFTCIFALSYGQSNNQAVTQIGPSSTGLCDEGEIFSKGNFKLKCQDGCMEIIACVANCTGSQYEIAPDKTVDVDGFWYKCETMGDKIKYDQEPRCTYNDIMYHIGQTLTQNSFVYACTEDGMAVSACLGDYEAKGTHIPVGQTVQVAGFWHKCAVENDNVIYSTETRCFYNGVSHKLFATIEDATFQYSCLDSGFVAIGCLISAKPGPDGTRPSIKIGRSIIADNLYHKCYETPKGIFYSRQICQKEVVCDGRSDGTPLDYSLLLEPFCIDQKTRRINGEIWTDGGFKYSCQADGRVVIRGCMTKGENSMDIEIPMNTTVTLQGFWQKCQESEMGVQYVIEPRCSFANVAYHVGDTFKNDTITLSCRDESIIEVTGCYFPDLNGDLIELKLGQNLILKDGTQYRCPKIDGYFNIYADYACIYDGQTYQPGDQIDVGNNFVYRCVANADAVITGCHIENSATVCPVGKGVVVGDNYYRCIRNESRIYVTSQKCGTDVLCDGVNDGKLIIAYGPGVYCVKNDVRYEINQEFVSGSFKYVCQKNGYASPQACVVYDKANTTIVVPFNEQVTVDGFWFKCVFADGMIRPTNEPRCPIGGNLYHVNETAIAPPFILFCAANYVTEVRGCCYNDSKGNEISIFPNQSILLDGVVRRCTRNKTLTYTCIYNGTVYEPGQKWILNENKRYMFTCMIDGDILLSDCVVEDGIVISAGSGIVLRNMYHRCLRTVSGGLKFESLPCGKAVLCDGEHDGLPITRSVFKQPVVKPCDYKNTTYAFGQTWVYNNFQFLCGSNGYYSILGCSTSDGVLIAVNQVIVKNKIKHSCFSNPDGSISYRKASCNDPSNCKESIDVGSSNHTNIESGVKTIGSVING